MFRSRNSLILCLVLGLSVPAFAQVKGQALQRSRGGSNNGGGTSSEGISDEVLKWCQGSQGILQKYLTNARGTLERQGNLKLAEKELMDGLQAALDHKPDSVSSDSLTYRAIARGLELGQALAEATAGEDESDRFVISFLEKYYAFVNEVTQRMDADIYIPYAFGASLETGKFEEQYGIYAKSELEWITSQFTFEIAPGKRGAIAPVQGYPKALEYITAHTASDLEETIHHARYSCAIITLRGVAAALADYNQGSLGSADHPGYADDVQAVNDSYNQVQESIHQLGNSCSGI